MTHNIHIDLFYFWNVCRVARNIRRQQNNSIIYFSFYAIATIKRNLLIWEKKFNKRRDRQAHNRYFFVDLMERQWWIHRKSPMIRMSITSNTEQNLMMYQKKELIWAWILNIKWYVNSLLIKKAPVTFKLLLLFYFIGKSQSNWSKFMGKAIVKFLLFILLFRRMMMAIMRLLLR
jgi:hypothetical protein